MRYRDTPSIWLTFPFAVRGYARVSIPCALPGEIGRRLRPRREHGHRDGYHQRQEHPEKAVLSPCHRLGSPCDHRHRRRRHDGELGV